MSEFMTTIKERARGSEARILFPEAGDERVVEAALKLKEDGLGEPIMVHPIGGTAEKVPGLTHVTVEEGQAAELAKLLVELRGHKGMTEEEAQKLAHDPLIYGMYLLRKGEADALVAGAVRTTSDVVRSGLWLVDKEPEIKTISSSFYMLTPASEGGRPGRVLTFADCGVVENPTVDQLADIAIAAADARKFIAGDEPKIAFLSFSTSGSGGSGETITRLRQAIGQVQKRRPDLAVAEHELQGDAALLEEVAARKAPGSAVAGQANVLVFPSLDAANIAYKILEAAGGAKAIGPILHGFASPVHDLSRGVKMQQIVDSAAIAAVRVKGK
jgi:phosphate acetyltransferase